MCIQQRDILLWDILRRRHHQPIELLKQPTWDVITTPNNRFPLPNDPHCQRTLSSYCLESIQTIVYLVIHRYAVIQPYDKNDSPVIYLVASDKKSSQFIILYSDNSNLVRSFRIGVHVSTPRIVIITMNFGLKQYPSLANYIDFTVLEHSLATPKKSRTLNASSISLINLTTRKYRGHSVSLKKCLSVIVRVIICIVMMATFSYTDCLTTVNSVIFVPSTKQYPIIYHRSSKAYSGKSSSS